MVALHRNPGSRQQAHHGLLNIESTELKTATGPSMLRAYGHVAQIDIDMLTLIDKGLEYKCGQHEEKDGEH